MAVPRNAKAHLLLKLIGIALPLALIAGACLYCYRFVKCIDGCGPYHNTTSVADLDGDGDLDVVLSNLRHETETAFWAGPTLWINAGGGRFNARRVDFGGPSTVAGDVDGDEDPDIVQMDYGASIFLNQGGDQGGELGDFKRWSAITPREDPHGWSTPGTVVLGDLNNDGRLDAMVSYCCSMLIDGSSLQDGVLPFLPWVWINIADEQGRPTTQSHNLTSIGDLPMRPTLADLNGDGSLDVYAALLPPKPGPNYIAADRVLFNDGRGNFVDSGQRLHNARLSGAAGSGTVALGDLDGDGDLDALVGTAAGAAIWSNQGGAEGGNAGTFADSGQRLGRAPVEAVFLADLDSDGDLDPLMEGRSQAIIWWNDGEAGFRDFGQRLKYTERYGLAIGDFNGDGSTDVFAGVYDLGYHLWLNEGDGRLREAPSV